VQYAISIVALSTRLWYQ